MPINQNHPSEIESLKQELKETRARLDELQKLIELRQKQDANFHNEIRSPLSLIIGAVNLLKMEEPLTESQQELIDIMERSSQKIHQKLDGALSVSTLLFAARGGVEPLNFEEWRLRRKFEPRSKLSGLPSVACVPMLLEQILFLVESLVLDYRLPDKYWELDSAEDCIILRVSGKNIRNWRYASNIDATTGEVIFDSDTGFYEFSLISKIVNGWGGKVFVKDFNEDETIVEIHLRVYQSMVENRTDPSHK